MRTSPLHPALHAALFLAGLAAVAWVGAGYLAFHPAGVAVLLVIAACYIAGAIELYRYRQATTSLAAAQSDPEIERATTEVFHRVLGAQAWFKLRLSADSLGDKPMQTEKAVEITGGG